MTTGLIYIFSRGLKQMEACVAKIANRPLGKRVGLKPNFSICRKKVDER